VALEGDFQGSFFRLDIDANPHLEWKTAGKIESGHMAMYQIGPNKMRRFGSGHTLSFRVSPAQPCFAPENVISGYTRPNHFTNLWKSDPEQQGPQWLQLQWNEMKNIGQVELTFPGHLVREYHAYDPFYRDPQCPKNFAVQSWDGHEWQTVYQVKDNYQRQVKLTLPQTMQTDTIRIQISETNGDPSAQVYEVRCYA
jgi:hypothetical protein